MANKIPERGNFSVSSEVFDEHEWISDWFIDGEFGVTCKIGYPPTDGECPNCLFDPGTGYSANVYKTGGPISFPQHTVCPWCGGRGLMSIEQQEDIRLRVYWGGTNEPAAAATASSFNQLVKQTGFNSSAGDAIVIGYMDDLPKFRRSNYILVYSDLNIEYWKCSRASEAKPWGFRKNRYFCAMIKRNG